MSGVTQFVHRQNSVPQYDGTNDAKPGGRKSNKGSYDDLKVKISNSRPGTPSVSRPRVNSHRARGGGQSGAAPRSRSQAETHPGLDNGFVDTDASNADRTSGPGSMQHPDQGQLTQHRPASDFRTKSEAGSCEETDAEFKGAESPYDVHLPPAHDQQSAVQPHRFTDRRVSGDSYPATTSGRPSEVDFDDTQHGQPSTQAHALGMQVSHSVNPTQVVRGGRGQPGDITAPTAAQVVKPPNHIHVDLIQGFRFDKMQQPYRAQPQSQTVQQPQSQRRQQHGVLPQSKPAAQHVHLTPLDTSQSTPAAAQYVHADNERGHTANPETHERDHERDMTLGNIPNRQPTLETKRHTQSPDTGRLKRSDHGVTLNQRHSQSRLRPDSDQSQPESQLQDDIDGQGLEDMLEGQPAEHPPEQPLFRESSPDVDIFPPELFQMDYADVKAQAFDFDPHARTFALPQVKSTDTFHDKLVAVMPIGGQAQIDFFSTLTAEQWEETGDWFLERFGELVGKLKESRKEKRKVARAFEDEIEQRHEAVADKRRLTLSALRDMKESGGRVLQGTPKKSGKTKK